MDTKVMIIGTGPYGISLAKKLHDRGVPFIIAGRPFELWFRHTLNTMAIRSDRHASQIYSERNEFNLTHFIRERYPEQAEEILTNRLPIDVLRDYFKDVLSRLDFPIDEQYAVELDRQRDHFETRLEDGTVIRSESVVIATGIGNHRFLPESLKKLDPALVHHTYYVEEFSDWKERELIVIGSGQSAAESIAHLKDKNRITWVYRSTPVYYSEPINLPKPLFHLVLNISNLFYFLPKGTKKAMGKKFVESTITPDMLPYVSIADVDKVQANIDELALTMQDSRIYSKKRDCYYDGIVSATGYHYDINTIGFLSSELISNIKTERRVPVLDYNFETSVPGLYMIGGISEPAFGPSQRFIIGNGFAACRIYKALVR